MKRSWALKLTLVLALLICVSPLLHMTPLGKKASADTTLSISDLAKKATTDGPCSKSDNSCIAGYVAGYKNADDGSFPSESDFCQTGSSVGGAQYKVTSVSKCKTGYEAGASQAPGATSGSTSAANGNPSNSKLSCVYGPLSWIVCPFVDLLVGMVGAIDTLITNELFVNTSQIFCDSTSGNCNDYFQAWQAFRNISLGLMAIAGLVILISQALGMEILDAYTIRKTLPRLLIAAIGITLSWPLMKFFVTFTNDLGFSVKDLILAPFSNLKDSISLNFGQSGIVALVGGLAAASLGIFGILSYMVTAALAVMIAVVVLILRQIVITLAIIVAPIGIVAYVLPNTQRVYKIWWETFSKALLMFPLIIAFIAAGRVFSAIALNTHSSGLGLFYQTIGFVAYFAPYFLIPLTFRFASGFLAAAGGFINDRGRGGFDRLRKSRARQVQQRGQRAAAGNLYRASNPLARTANRLVRGVATSPTAGVTPWKWRSRYQAGLSTGMKTARQEYMEKSDAFKAIMGNDDYLQATMRSAGGGDSEDDWRRYLSAQHYEGRSLEQGVALIRAAKRDTNDDVFKQAAVIANASTGTGWKETGSGGMYAAINEAFGDDRDGAIGALAEMRERANGSGRRDLGGASFNKQLGWMQDMHDGKIDATEATRLTSRRAWETNSAGQWAGQRGDALRHVAPLAMEEVRDAYASGNQLRIDRTLAKMANLQDNLNYFSPEGAEIMGDTLFAQPLGLPPERVMEPGVDDDGKPVLKPAFEKERDGSLRRDAAGNPVPLMRTRTLRTELNERRNSEEFNNIRRELYNRDEQIRMGPGGGGGEPPPPVPGN